LVAPVVAVGFDVVADEDRWCFADDGDRGGGVTRIRTGGGGVSAANAGLVEGAGTWRRVSCKIVLGSTVSWQDAEMAVGGCGVGLAVGRGE